MIYSEEDSPRTPLASRCWCRPNRNNNQPREVVIYKVSKLGSKFGSLENYAYLCIAVRIVGWQRCRR